MNIWRPILALRLHGCHSDTNTDSVTLINCLERWHAINGFVGETRKRSDNYLIWLSWRRVWRLWRAGLAVLWRCFRAISRAISRSGRELRSSSTSTSLSVTIIPHFVTIQLQANIASDLICNFDKRLFTFQKSKNREISAENLWELQSFRVIVRDFWH